MTSGTKTLHISTELYTHAQNNSLRSKIIFINRIQEKSQPHSFNQSENKTTYSQSKKNKEDKGENKIKGIDLNLLLASKSEL